MLVISKQSHPLCFSNFEVAHAITPWIVLHSAQLLLHMAYKLCLFCSNDESATETILKSYQIYANVCGILNLTTPRDAFITSLCKAALPPHYTLTVLNPHSGTAQVSYVKMPMSGSQSLSESQGGDHRGVGKSLSGSGEPGSGAVVTGIPLGSSHGPVSVSGVSSSVVVKFSKQYLSFKSWQTVIFLSCIFMKRLPRLLDCKFFYVTTLWKFLNFPWRQQIIVMHSQYFCFNS